MELFIKPDFKLPVAWFCDATLPLLLKYRNIQKVVIEPEDRRMLRSLRQKRLLFFSNHPTAAEPVLAYHIANVMGSRFHYMATRRAFDFYLGMVGELFRSVNVFSIIPGIPDKKSMRMARNVLANPGGKLVIYPEGEPVCGENDSLMPMMSGLVKLGLGGLEDARKQEADAEVMVLPGFIKYVIMSSDSEIQNHLQKSLETLEDKLKLDPGQRNLLRRFLRIGRVVLEKAEAEYGIDTSGNDDFDYRIGRLRHFVLDNVAQKLNIYKYDKDADAIQKLRHLTSVLELVELEYPNPHLPKLNKSDFSWAEQECIKAYDFITIKREYLVSSPTPERMYEWLARFESLVLGKKPRALGGESFHLPVKAVISFAKPWNLGEYYSQYQSDRNSVLVEVQNRIQKNLQDLLDKAKGLTKTIVDPYDVGEI